ncbi:hypothetical protein N665_1942s0007 [Sinapis alba]|nr:hypothetical protein N665_1942s0007 [Sinapis alba]
MTKINKTVKNPDAEVIALSPKMIMAKNRFLCEVCNKGFNREQNLELHRRVHNLSWKLKKKSEKEVRRKVYICYNLNRSSSKKFENFVPQPTNPNPGPTNFLKQCSLNQGLLAHNDQTLRSQHDLISLSDRINNNNNRTNLGYFQNNTKNSNQALFTHGAANNDPSAWLRGLTSSSSSFSSVAVNGFGQNQNGNLQDLMMNSLPVTKTQQGWSSSNTFTPHFGNNLSMGGCVSNGRNPAPLDIEMKFSYPNHPFGHP